MNPATGECLPLDEAKHKGMIGTEGKAPSLDQLLEEGLYDSNSGLVKEPTSGIEFGLQEAIEKGIVDRSTVKILDPNSGESVAITEACERGVMDPETGTVTHKISGEKMSFAESVKKGLMIAAAPLAAPVVLAKFAKDYFDNKTGKVQDPKSGKQMTLKEATEKRMVDPESITVIHPTSHEEVSLHGSHIIRNCGPNFRPSQSHINWGISVFPGRCVRRFDTSAISS